MRHFPACARCVFMRRDPDDAKMGRCRRYPPTYVTYAYTRYEGEVVSEGGSSFPVVSPEAWCGEFTDNDQSQFHPDREAPE